LGLPTEGSDVSIGTEQLPSLKSAVVVMILSFVEWRGEDETDGPLRLGVVGGETIHKAFLEHAGEDINRRQLEIIVLNDLSEIDQCHLLYISDDRDAPRDIIDNLDLDGLPGILTIGDSKSFNDDGGIIRLSLEKGKLVFTISTRHLDDENLFLSSRLLRVARIHNGR